MIFNAEKLHDELIAAGIPITGCNSNGDVTFAASATKKQKDAAATIVAAHNPALTKEQQLASFNEKEAAMLVRLSSKWDKLPQSKKDWAQAIIDASADPIIDIV